MKTLECVNGLKSFDFNFSGIFSEINEDDMLNIIGGSCGGGGGGWSCPSNWSPSLPGDPGQFGTTPSMF